MSRRGGIRVVLPVSALGAALIAAGPAQAVSGVELRVKGPQRVALLKKVEVVGSVADAKPNEAVLVTVSASGRELFKKRLDPKGKDGSFGFPVLVNACCRYVVEAKSASKRGSDSFQVRVPRRLGSGRATALYNDLLRAHGFHVGSAGRRVTIGTRLATKAFRKVNGMGRSEAYRTAIFRKLLRGDGDFKPEFRGGGRHVEVDISRQVMALIEDGEAVHTFHVSTGTSATPTIRGSFRFYRKEPGYNSKHMYYSIYFRGGYATHGYNPVPNYNASHGCVRNPILFSRFIYNWVQIGMPIHVYN